MMKSILILLLTLFLNNSCQKDFTDFYPYDPPEQGQDGLQVGTLEEANINRDMIFKAVGRIRHDKYGEIHSLLIYKNDRLVFEDYYEGHTYRWDAPNHYDKFVTWDKDKLHCVHSDTKSITSLCIGIALDLGYINNVNQSIFDYLPDHEYLKTPDKEKITIKHLLTMTSGLQWEEWKISLSSYKNDQIAIWFHEDGPVDYVLRKPLVAEPGSRFNYSGGDIQLLTEILKNATGMPLDEFSEEFLFKPMNIQSFDWWLIFPTGEVHGAGGLKLTPRGMVKIGAMMLDGGIWDETRIITEEWVQKCIYPYPRNTGIKVPGEDLGKVGYSYTWWTKNITYKGENINSYFALGWGGQKIMVLPELDMVVVFTGANYTSKVHEFEIMERFILPAIR